MPKITNCSQVGRFVVKWKHMLMCARNEVICGRELAMNHRLRVYSDWTRHRLFDGLKHGALLL